MVEIGVAKIELGDELNKIENFRIRFLNFDEIFVVIDDPRGFLQLFLANTHVGIVVVHLMFLSVAY